MMATSYHLLSFWALAASCTFAPCTMAMVRAFVGEDFKNITEDFKNITEEEEEALASNPTARDARELCDIQCTEYYKDTDVYDPCVEWCVDSPEYFDVGYPYVFGPLVLQPYPELTGIDGFEIKDLVGELWARVDKDRRKIQFRYRMETNPAPFYPYFAMHLHQGNLVPDEIGGHILVTIAGKGDLSGSFGWNWNSLSLVPCSDLCTDGNQKLGHCVRPGTFGQNCIITTTVAYAYFCQGGCQGDRRISGYDSPGLLSFLSPVQTVVPSRACDINKPGNPSDPIQDAWIQGAHSHEFSGNPDDGDDYSPYSIGVPENFELWCGDDLPFLVDEVLGKGQASYVALHVNFNSTGIPALAFGDVFTQLTSSEGGPNNCHIFGDISYPCEDGLGDLPPIQRTV